MAFSEEVKRTAKWKALTRRTFLLYYDFIFVNKTSWGKETFNAVQGQTGILSKNKQAKKYKSDSSRIDALS